MKQSVLFVVKYLLIIAVMFICNISNSQNYTESSEEIAEEMFIESKAYFSDGNNDSALIIANDLITYSIDNQLRLYKGKGIYYKGYIYLYSGFNDSALHYLQESINYFDIIEDDVIKGRTNLFLGSIFKSKSEYNEASQYYLESLKYFEKEKDSLWLGVANDHLGKIFFVQGNYYSSLSHYNKGIKIFLDLNIPLNVGSEYNAIGLVYRKTKNVALEEESYLKAIEILSKLEENNNLAQAYNNLSEVYLDDGRIEEGLECLRNAKAIYESLNDSIGLCAYYAVMSYYYSKNTPVDFDLVLENGLKGLEISKSIKSYRQYSDACYFVGAAYDGIKDNVNAKKYLEEGYEYAKVYGYNFELSRVSQALAIVCKKEGKFKQAFDLLEEHLELNDSIASDEKVREFTSLDLSHKFKEQQLKDSVLQVQRRQLREFEHEKEIQNQRFLQLMLGFLILTAIAISAFLYILYRRRNAQSEILNEKNKIINKSLGEKEILLKEIHHRVKNNFQTVSSLLELQTRDIVDEKAISNIEEGQSRIKAMALIHQKLYQNEDISLINMQDYIEQLVSQIAASYSLENVSIKVKANNIDLDIDTSIPLGLILNELITNSCKYAFEGKNEDSLSIELKRSVNSNYSLIYIDSGPGLPDNTDFEKVKSLGLRLIKRLAKQLQGDVDYVYDEGSVFDLTFKDTLARKMID